MRWTYVIPRLVIVALIWAFMAFGFDPLLRYSAIQSLQAVTGAKVDIASVRFDESLEWRQGHIRITTSVGSNL